MQTRLAKTLTSDMRGTLIWCREELEDIQDDMIEECGEGAVRHSLVNVLRHLYERHAEWTHECDQTARCVEQALSASKMPRVLRMSEHALTQIQRALA